VTITGHPSQPCPAILLQPLKRVHRVPKERFVVVIDWPDPQEDYWGKEGDEELPFTLKL
jgi:hypothetical protein